MSRGRRPHHLALNRGLVFPVVGGAVAAVGLAMLICAAVALLYGDGGALAFAVPGALATPLGLAGVAVRTRVSPVPLRARDGYFAVTMAYLASALVGAVPFLLAGTFTHPFDALFESMSGLTGCGASVLEDVEAQPHAVLLWRSLSQFLGGVGIVLLVVAVAPATGLSSQRLFFAESSSPTIERLTPRIADTAKIIWGVYAAMTVAAALAFVLAGMGPFDAINHAFTGLGAGGFSTRAASLGAFDSLAVELVALAVMFAAGINLAFYWRALRGQPLRPQLAEVRAYALVVGATILAVAASLLVAGQTSDPVQALRSASFPVVSLATTTGWTTEDFDAFNDFARLSLLVIPFMGGCAGSTAGGLKVVRVMLLASIAVQEVQRQLQPQAVQVLRMPGKVFSEDVRRTVLGFFFVWLTVWAAGTMALAACGLDPVTAASAASAGINLAGVALGEVGASENFSAIPTGGRPVMALLMLVGRLEVFTVIALLTPAFWRRQWA